MGGTSGPCKGPTTNRCYNFVADYNPLDPKSSLCPLGTEFCGRPVAPHVSNLFYEDLCGGTTENGHTPWTAFGEDGLNVEVDTTKCELKQGHKPAYVVSIVEGDKSNEWAGSSIIYFQTHTSFRLFLFHDYLRSERLLDRARSSWQVSYIVDRSRTRSGRFVPKRWRQHSANAIEAIIDTSSAGFAPHTPRYFTTFAVEDSHWRAEGSHHVYDATPTGFRLFLMSHSEKLHASKATKNGWGINWVATLAAVSGSWPPVGTSSTSTKGWQRDAQHKTLYMDVDASAIGLSSNPTYVISISGSLGSSAKWKGDVFSGGAVVHAPTGKGFRVYLKPSFCKQKMWQQVEHCSWLLERHAASEDELSRWRVNYVAVEERTNCKVAQWGEWGECNTPCGGGRQNRTRIVKRRAWAGGAQCPHLVEYDRCNDQSCAPTIHPTPAPTPATPSPTSSPTLRPTPAPTPPPSPKASKAPTPWPTPLPTPFPTPWRARITPVIGDTQYKFNENRLPGCDNAAAQSGAACVGRGNPLRCGGRTPRGTTAWRLFGTSALYLDVDASECGFKTTPIFLINLDGDDKHWQLQGGNTVYSMHETGFRVIVAHPTRNAAMMWRDAMKYRWAMSWVAVMGSQAGFTPWGGTPWHALRVSKKTEKGKLAKTLASEVDSRYRYKLDGADMAEAEAGAADGAKGGALFLDVNTRDASFESVPRYFTSLHGKAMYWGVEGAHDIYRATRDGFRMCVWEVKGRWGLMTAKKARHMRWSVGWVGVETSGWSAHDSGTGAARWRHGTEVDGAQTVRMHIDTSLSGYTHTPAYVTSLSKDSRPLLVSGAAAVFGASPTGFDVVMADPVRVDALRLMQWRVNYIAFEPTRYCEVTPWSDWSPCDRLCGGGNEARTRNITRAGSGPKERRCPALRQRRACATRPCGTTLAPVVPIATGAPQASGSVPGKLKPPPKGSFSDGGHTGVVYSLKSLAQVTVDCRVSGWASWGNCSRACGGGARSRERVVLREPQGFGARCPALTEHHACDKSKCRTVVGALPSRVCGATTPSGPTPWKLYGNGGGLYVDIDTTDCGFPAIPAYVCSVVGQVAHWHLSGSTSITGSSITGFRLIVMHPSIKGLGLLLAAQYYKWQASWLGSCSTHTGSTEAGRGGWRRTEHRAGAPSRTPKTVAEQQLQLVELRQRSLMIDVDTSGCYLPPFPTPRYFTALHGNVRHHRAEGAHAVYFPTEKGFRVYIVYRGGAPEPWQAEAWGWRIVFLASQDDTHSGESGLDWRHTVDKKGLQLDVDTSQKRFAAVAGAATPSYVASVTTDFMHWRVTGAASIYRPTTSGFRLFLDGSTLLEHHTTHVKLAKMYKWRVMYYGYVPTPPTPPPSLAPTKAPTSAPTPMPTPAIEEELRSPAFPALLADEMGKLGFL
eukprot:g4724.t1